MLLVYAVSAIVASVLVLLSIFGADHGGDHDVHVDAHAEGESPALWLPFFSLRFYTYFFAGFGTTGLLISYLAKTDPTLTLWISGIVGLGCGFSVSILMRLLRISENSGGASDKDVLGKEGQVLVPIRGSTPGRIRCTVKGDIIDFLATTEETRALEAGETVVVVSMDNGRALVMPRDAIFGSEHPSLTHKGSD